MNALNVEKVPGISFTGEETFGSEARARFEAWRVPTLPHHHQGIAWSQPKPGETGMAAAACIDSSIFVGNGDGPWSHKHTA